MFGEDVTEYRVPLPLYGKGHQALIDGFGVECIIELLQKSHELGVAYVKLTISNSYDINYRTRVRDTLRKIGWERIFVSLEAELVTDNSSEVIVDDDTFLSVEKGVQKKTIRRLLTGGVDEEDIDEVLDLFEMLKTIGGVTVDRMLEFYEKSDCDTGYLSTVVEKAVELHKSKINAVTAMFSAFDAIDEDNLVEFDDFE